MSNLAVVIIMKRNGGDRLKSPKYTFVLSNSTYFFTIILVSCRSIRHQQRLMSKKWPKFDMKL
jgi:hypothetical protein